MYGFMNVLFVIFGTLFLIFFLAQLVLGGLKKIFTPIIEWGERFRIRYETPQKPIPIEKAHSDSNENSYESSTQPNMREIRILEGRCDVCGETFITTSDDPCQTLMKVSIVSDNGQSLEDRTICRECLRSIYDKYAVDGQSTKVNISSHAKFLLKNLEKAQNKDV